MNSNPAIHPLTLVRYASIHKSLPLDLRLCLNTWNLDLRRPILRDDSPLWVGAYSDSYGHFLIDGRIYCLGYRPDKMGPYAIAICPFYIDNLNHRPTVDPALDNWGFCWTDDAAYNTGVDHFDDPGRRICVIPLTNPDKT